MKKKLFFYISVAAILLSSACNDDDTGLKITQIKDFYSTGSKDGYIEHRASPLKPIIHGYYSHSQGKSLCTGWDANGRPMRSFLSFDISEIAGSADKELVIEEAILNVYEANTNLNPFNADGLRTVDCFLISYETLSTGTYDLAPEAACGTITSTGHNVLKEYPLNVTSALNNYLKENPAANSFQFRLQFIPDEATVPLSKLSSAMWLIFSGKEDGSKKDYRPKLSVKYYYKKK